MTLGRPSTPIELTESDWKRLESRPIHEFERLPNATAPQPCFTALDSATGEVLTHANLVFVTKNPSSSSTFRDNVHYLDVQLIIDNCSTHKYARVKKWLTRHPRFHVHYTQPMPPGSTRPSGVTRSAK